MDIELCYQTFGDASHPPVLLIGGLNMQSYAWDERFCDLLVSKGFFVIRFDNRDIGFSTKIDAAYPVVPWRLLLPRGVACCAGERLSYTLDDMAFDGLSLLDVLNIRRAHFFGISMGGMIAQCMSIIAPSRCMSLTCIMSSTNAGDLPAPALWVKLWLLRRPSPGTTGEQLVEFRAKTLLKLLYGTMPVDEEYLKKRISLSLNRSSYGEGLLRQAAAIIRAPSRDEALRRIDCPALIIHGSGDVLCPVQHGYRLAQVLRNSKLVVYKNMGHYFNSVYFEPIVEEFVLLAERAASEASGSAAQDS
jgi:pimeloyl-ACP methyl ester carboxylesterase